MPGHQGIEEVAQSGQGLILGGGGPGKLVQEPAGQAGGHLAQLQPLVLAPSEKSAHLVGVGGPGVGVGEPSGEELIGRETGRLAGFHEDGRKGPFDVVFRQRIGGGRDELLINRK